MEEEARLGHITDVARVEIEIEAAALREALGSQQQSIQELYTEIEEERAAASTAASEAMSMILRLQREKAEAEMDARQFKRFAEEKMSHDQQEIALLEDLLFKRDEAVQSLACEIQAYRHRLLSYGINPVPTEPNSPTAITPVTTPTGETYPPIRCELAEIPVNAENPDLKYASCDSPRDHLQRMPNIITEKGVIANGHSPRWAQRSLRQLSTESYDSPSFRQELGRNELPSMVGRSSDTGGRDDVSDRVYTIDAVHGGDGVYDGTNMSTPRDFASRRESSSGNVDEGEVRRLYTRLQALEADRESMRQAINTIGTDKAQMLLLKEIAQQLCKEPKPETRIVQKPSNSRSFSVMSVLKWVASLFFWWNKPSKIKYPFEPLNQKTGLLVILDKTQRKRLKRCLTRVPR